MKQILDRVTITGADDSTDIAALLTLSEEFPFVEWGILISERHMGSRRYPSETWLQELSSVATHMRTSAHLCGRVVRDLLIGKDSLWPDWQEDFSRAQLNFHAESFDFVPQRFAAVIGSDVYRHLQWIFQIDGNRGQFYYDQLCETTTEIDAVVLFDLSGGAGILPETWPLLNLPYMGYAGGLSPENVATQLDRIEQLVQAKCWIDVETHVRSENKFDLSKVRAFLEAARPWVIETP